MAEEKKYYVHKSGGYYYTENRIPVRRKVLFEGTEKECYEFVTKEMAKKELKEQFIIQGSLEQTTPLTQQNVLSNNFVCCYQVPQRRTF